MKSKFDRNMHLNLSYSLLHSGQVMHALEGNAHLNVQGNILLRHATGHPFLLVLVVNLGVDRSCVVDGSCVVAEGVVGGRRICR